jgi:hypothetical protein
VKLTAARRRALTPSQFALTGGHYPIDTANRARDALSRGAANATPAQQAEIRAAVKRKYPTIKLKKRTP